MQQDAFKYTWGPFLGGVALTMLFFFVWQSSLSIKNEDSITAPAPVGTEIKEDYVPPKEPSEEPPAPPRTRRDLKVSWLPEPRTVDATSFGLELPYVLRGENRPFESFYTIYQVGVLGDGYDVGKRVFLIERTCDGPCGSSHYRAFERDPGVSWEIVKIVSNAIAPVDYGLFYVSDEYDIPSLRLPPRIHASYQGKELDFDEEFFNPATTFSDFMEYKTTVREIPFGKNQDQKLYELGSGNFVVRVPDGTVKLYHLAFPFALAPDESYFKSNKTALELRFDNGETYNGTFWTNNPFAACPPVGYEVYNDTLMTRLVKQGVIVGDGDFYEPKDFRDELYDARNYGNSLDDDAFSKTHPVIFWRDELDRLVALSNTLYGPFAETECSYINSVL